MATLVSTKALLRRARESEGGEAYTSVAKGPGFRIGAGARVQPNRGSTVFVEVLLDPFPDRPRVVPGHLAQGGVVIEQLEARGYVVACDDDGTIACERTVAPQAVAGEIRALRRLIELNGPDHATDRAPPAP